MSWQAADVRLRLRSVVVIWLLMLGGALLFLWTYSNAGLERAISANDWVLHHQALINLLTDLSLYPFYLLFAALLAIGWWRGDACLRTLGQGYIMAQLLGAVLIVRILKMSTGHARPSVHAQGLVDSWIGPTTESAFHSFPSGHTADLFTSTMFLAVLAPRLWQRVLLLTYALLAGMTRLAHSSHYPNDMIAGAFIGGAVTLCIMHCWMRSAVARHCGIDTQAD